MAEQFVLSENCFHDVDGFNILDSTIVIFAR